MADDKKTQTREEQNLKEELIQEGYTGVYNLRPTQKPKPEPESKSKKDSGK